MSKKKADATLKDNTTHKEIEFLDGVVKGEWVRDWTPTRAKNALQGYINTALVRVWDGGVNARAAQSYAISLLDRM